MSDSFKIALAQLNLLVGDVHGNATRVITTTRKARAEFGADLVLFPELTLSGYPPEDLLFHRGLPAPDRDGPGARAPGSAGLERGDRLSRVHPRGDLQFGRPDFGRGGGRHPSQGRTPELQGVRREALFPTRSAAHRGGSPGIQDRHARLRGHLGAGVDPSSPAPPGRSSSSSSMPRRTSCTSSVSARTLRGSGPAMLACRSPM